MAVRVYNYSSKTPSLAEPLLGELSLDCYLEMTSRLVKLNNLKSVGMDCTDFDSIPACLDLVTNGLAQPATSIPVLRKTI